MVHLALEAADMLAAEGISAEVINIHTVKPIDSELICASARKTGCVVTAEEHSVIGGLGSAVCDVLAENHPVPTLKVGVEDSFGRSGKVPELLEIYGLTSKNIYEKAKLAIAKK
jgi:transketolase